jgi:hypothetical protein
MPTELPPRRELPPPDRGDEGFRHLMIAATVALSMLGLIVEQAYGPLPGYSLAQTHGDLQLSP